MQNFFRKVGGKHFIQRPTHNESNVPRPDLCLRWIDSVYPATNIKKYPDAEITTYYLGSDQNKQSFAFIRTSYAGGRSRNLDDATMAYGIEKRNVRSELSVREDTSVVAHTRRRTVMRPAVPSPMVRSCSFSSNSEVTTIAKEKRNVWTGRMIEVSKLAKCMD